MSDTNTTGSIAMELDDKDTSVFTSNQENNSNIRSDLNENNPNFSANYVQTKLQETFSKNQQLEAEISNLKLKLEESEENCKRFTEQLDKLGHDNKLYKELYEKKVNNNEFFGNSKIPAIVQDLSLATYYDQIINELNQKLNEQGSQINADSKKIATYKGLFEQLKNDNKELQKDKEHLQSQCTKLDQQLKDKKSQVLTLKKKNDELENEASNYQSALGVTTNFKMRDDDKNHNVQLNEDILSLQDKIDEYVTSLVKTKVDVKIEEIIKLLPTYGCQANIDSKKPDKQFIKAILQRYVLDTIFVFANHYFTRGEKDYYLESDVVKKTHELIELMIRFASTRHGTDEITRVTPIKLRQLIYTALGMRGLGDIISEKEVYFHVFVEKYTNKLNELTNQYRVITDPKKKEYTDGLAENIIREVFRIFYFRLKVQEPEVEYYWFKCGEEVSEISMKASWDEENIDELVVELCAFPVIFQRIGENNKIFTPAKVFTRHVPKSNFIKSVGNVGSRIIKSVTKLKPSNKNSDQNNDATGQNTENIENTAKDESNYNSSNETTNVPGEVDQNENQSLDIEDENKSANNEKKNSEKT